MVDRRATAVKGRSEHKPDSQSFAIEPPSVARVSIYRSVLPVHDGSMVGDTSDNNTMKAADDYFILRSSL